MFPLGDQAPEAIGVIDLARPARADVKPYVAGRRIGEVQDDERGRALARDAAGWMAGQNIRSPARMTGMLVPGFRDME